MYPRFAFSLPPAAATCTTVASASTAIAASDLEKLHVLGHGNGGTLYKVRHRRTSKVYALKIVHGRTDSTVRSTVLREMQSLRRLDSPHIVQCHGIYEQQFGDIAILMEYMDAGTLETLLRKNGTFSQSLLARVGRQILKGLSNLNTRKIIHRDIKPSNVPT